MDGRYRVQLRRRGKAPAGPEILIPAPPLDPLAGWKLRRALRYGLQESLAGEVAEIEIPQAHSVPHQVEVGIDETGNHQRPLQILDEGPGSVSPGQCLLIQREDPLAADGQCPRIGRTHIAGVEEAVFQHPGPHLNPPPAAEPARELHRSRPRRRRWP